MSKPLFEKVLIANRGEIALRIMRTLRKMDIKSVAVYSEADTNSDHVQYADEAYYIGNSPATESYLSIKNIVSAIRVSGVQAVHPGYGFLAENSQFANILKREGITLIGPSAKVIKQMGDKIEAKKIAIDSGVSTVPGYMGIINNFEQAVGIAEEIGFPIIIKAAAGGGGRGMRVVQNPKEMEKAFESAKELFPDNPLRNWADYLLIESYEQQGNSDKSKDEINKLVKTENVDPILKRAAQSRADIQEWEKQLKEG